MKSGKGLISLVGAAILLGAAGAQAQNQVGPWMGSLAQEKPDRESCVSVVYFLIEDDRSAVDQWERPRVVILLVSVDEWQDAETWAEDPAPGSMARERPDREIRCPEVSALMPGTEESGDQPDSESGGSTESC
ncbi:MAG: hypothetical protein HYY65_13600 [Candidatus Tectomicrobia bacterium]|uniref:Uncharacterized protein n=1 Tax=Tectimicrobiota bacterium TaxID=2528274 RepID=A0A932M214_UNCTE|nr:hypothetical protein [Candidatus Tectomicrobia bacterium]